MPSRFVNGHHIVLAVSINHTGPYNFLLDSGTQITMIDPSLAAALHLDNHGAAVVAGVGSRQSAWFAQLDLVEAASHAVVGQNVLVYNLQNLHPANLPIQGILGEDFLEHFDMLIDNEHRLLCLDDSAAMRAEVKKPHIPLLVTAQPDGVALPDLLIIEVRLSDGLRPVRLLLDSGTNTAKLYNTSQYMVLQISHRCAFTRERCGWRTAGLFALAPTGREDRITQIAPRALLQPRRHSGGCPCKGVRRCPGCGALPARLHRPRRSLCRP